MSLDYVCFLCFALIPMLVFPIYIAGRVIQERSCADANVEDDVDGENPPQEGDELDSDSPITGDY